MNTLRGTIVVVKNMMPFNIVTVDVNGRNFRAFTLELGPCYKPGAAADIVFKESDVVLINDRCGRVSMENGFPCVVKKIRTGAVLSEVFLSADFGEVFSMISAESAGRLALREGDRVNAFVRADEISLSEAK